MQRLRRLSGPEVVQIFERLGFVIIRVRGSHHVMRRTIQIKQGVETMEEVQTINIPVHGNKPVGPGLLKRFFREASQYIPEEELKTYFYSE